MPEIRFPKKVTIVAAFCSLIFDSVAAKTTKTFPGEKPNCRGFLERNHSERGHSGTEVMVPHPGVTLRATLEKPMDTKETKVHLTERP